MLPCGKGRFGDLMKSSAHASGGKRLDHRITRIAILWTLAAWLAVSGLTWAGAFKPADRWVVDLVAGLTPAPGASEDIVVVTIDTPSFQAIGEPWPWPRSRHAALLDAAGRAGARAVVFDIVFDAGTPDDQEFAEAVARFGPVFLAAERSTIRTPQGLIETLALPVPALAQAAAGTGFADLPLDGDGRLRRLPANPDSLAAISARRLDGVEPPLVPPDRYIRFSRRPILNAVSYYQALSPETHLPPDRLRGRILLVGLALKASPTASAVGDTLLLPSHVGGPEPQPGVTAHAAALGTLLRGDALTRAPRVIEAIPGFSAFLLTLALVSGFSRAILLGMAGAAGGLACVIALAWLAYGAGWVILTGPALAGLGLSAFGQVALIGGAALAARRRLAAGFERYVSPEILRRILDAPNPPELGGEERVISVIVTDLEGFTALMDRLGPGEGAALLRDYLDTLSGIVLDHGGMIDQFIGDSLVALFNAPLDQSDHAARAVACVRALDSAGAAFGRKNQGVGRTRIGAAMGPAIVGNFGARRRFHYTAMGDVVNVAARLEAANKGLETSALVSEALFAAAGTPDGFGPPCTFDVAGKVGPVRAVPLRRTRADTENSA